MQFASLVAVLALVSCAGNSRVALEVGQDAGTSDVGASAADAHDVVLTDGQDDATSEADVAAPLAPPEGAGGGAVGGVRPP